MYLNNKKTTQPQCPTQSYHIRSGCMAGHESQMHISFPHLHAINSDIVGLRTSKCSSQPAGSSKHGCYGKSTSCASEDTEILTLASLHMIPHVVPGSAGSSGQRLRFAKSQASLLPKFNLFNIGQGGSAIDSSLIVEIKFNLSLLQPN